MRTLLGDWVGLVIVLWVVLFAVGLVIDAAVYRIRRRRRLRRERTIDLVEIRKQLRKRDR